jgi:hypothetical protein
MRSRPHKRAVFLLTGGFPPVFYNSIKKISHIFPSYRRFSALYFTVREINFRIFVRRNRRFSAPAL